MGRFSRVLTAAVASVLLLGLLDTAVASSASAEAVVTVPASRMIPIAGHGWGHGRGMSQHGAYGAAKVYHRSAAQILDFYYPGTATKNVGNPRIRVQLRALGSGTVTVQNPGSLTFYDEATGRSHLATKTTSAPQQWRLYPTSGGIGADYLVGSTWKRWYLTLHGPVRIDVVGSSSTQVLYPAARTYTSSYLRMTALSTSSQSTTSFTTMETYLRGVVPAESLSSWPAATLQAQTLAARTYADWYLAHPLSPDSDICDTTSCQVYGGDTAAAASTDAAIKATAGQVRTYQGVAFKAEFSASNGGWTTSGGAPYLPAKADPYDGAVPSSSHAWTATLPASALESRYPQIGRLTSFVVTSRDGNGAWGGRVKGVTLRGTKGSVSVSGAGVYSAWSWPAHSTGLRSSWWSLRPVGPDVTGDGVGDLVAGAPGRSVSGSAGAGALALVPGRWHAPISTGGPLLTQASAGVPGAPEPGDRLAGSTTVGDFNGDGYDDVVVGVADEALGTVAHAGLVQVVRGVPSGLTSHGLVQITLESPGVAGASSPGTRFGTSVAAGDVNGDGYDDLAIGTPAATIGGHANAGMVTFVPGSSSGLVTSRAQTWTQSSTGVLGSPETGDRFGAVLAVGDVDGDGRLDLAVGAPGERDGTAASGMVQLLRGTSAGLVASTGMFGTQMGNPGSFGRALALGDIDRDGHADLAAGGAGTGAGALTLVKGRTTGLTGPARTFSQNSPRVPGGNEADDSFAAAVATGDLNGDGYSDVVVGNPTETLGSHTRSGYVTIFYGAAGDAASGPILGLSKDNAGVAGAVAAGDLYGAAVAVSDLNGDGIGDVEVGAPGASSSSGTVSVVYGTEKGLTGIADRLLSLTAVHATPAARDVWGSSLAGG